MLFLFEYTLTHYIYIVFYTLISRAHPAHNLGNFYAMGRHDTPTATPLPRSEQLHAMSNHTPNGIRAHNDRHTIANDPGNLHTHEQPRPERHPGRTHRPPHPRPVGRGHIPVKSGLTSSIPMDCSAAVALSRSRFAQNRNLL